MDNAMQDHAIIWILGVLFTGLAAIGWYMLRGFFTNLLDSMKAETAERKESNHELSTAINALRDLIQEISKKQELHEYQIKDLQQDVRDLQERRRGNCAHPGCPTAISG